MRTHAKVVSVLAVTLIAMFFVSEIQAWPWSKKEEKEVKPLIEFPSGWKIMKITPAAETSRVDKFETKFSGCEPCLEMAYNHGNFKMFQEMRRNSYENWWAVVVYIPPGQFLNITENGKIIMEAINKQGEAVNVESEKIAFSLGWISGYERARQHTVLDNSERGFQVKSSQDPGQGDFEWTHLGNKDGNKYVVGYVYFGDHEKLKRIIGFSVEGMDSYPTSQALLRR